jgi:hypothetical protein
VSGSEEQGAVRATATATAATGQAGTLSG